MIFPLDALQIEFSTQVLNTKMLSDPVRWKTWSAECGKWGVWKMKSVENEECRKRGVWKMRSVENAECGK